MQLLGPPENVSLYQEILTRGTAVATTRVRYAQVAINTDRGFELIVRRVEPSLWSEFIGVRAPKILVPVNGNASLKLKDSCGSGGLAYKL